MSVLKKCPFFLSFRSNSFKSELENILCPEVEMKQLITDFSQGATLFTFHDNVCNEIHILVTSQYLKLF